jgi:hypothetical protein
MANSLCSIIGKIADSGGAEDALRYEVRPRKDHRGIDLISDALPFGRLWRTGCREQRNRLRGSFPAVHTMP